MPSLTPPNPRDIVGFGYYNKRGCPKLTFRINGHKFYGTIDTGFTGFISLPSHFAEDLGLRPVGLSIATLADGVSVMHPVCVAPVTFYGRTHKGHVMVSPPNTHPLVGLEFLHKFHLGLVITKDLVILVDENWGATATKRGL